MPRALPKPYADVRRGRSRLRFFHGDAVDILGALKTASVDAIVTSPPYNLGIRYRSYDDGRPRAEYLRWTAEWIQAAKQVAWDLDAYPILVWSWRPVEFPKGADEREGSTNDSALAVYMLVDYSRIRGPKAVKYIWSERVPIGTRLSSNMGLTQVKVLRSGPPSGQEWVEERVDVRDDFKKFFSQNETPKPAGIAVLTDSDDTKSSAQGEYRGFRACRS